MNVDGTGARRPRTNSAPDVGPTWAPDAKRIAFFTAGATPPTGLRHDSCVAEVRRFS